MKVASTCKQTAGQHAFSGQAWCLITAACPVCAGPSTSNWSSGLQASGFTCPGVSNWADCVSTTGFWRDPCCMYASSLLMGFHPDQPWRRTGWGFWCCLCLYVVFSACTDLYGQLCMHCARVPFGKPYTNLQLQQLPRYQATECGNSQHDCISPSSILWGSRCPPAYWGPSE